MKVFVTGIGGQLGHDCVNELLARGYEAVGSDKSVVYNGVLDGSAVTTAPYIPLDITDAETVSVTVGRMKPDAIIHCATWTHDCKAYAPLNYYGQTKLEGEQVVSDIMEKYFIVRIALAFGLNGKNFIKTMINVGKTHDTVRVVNNQISTPTYTLDLARLLVDMIETEKYGYYHVTNEGGYISWYEFCVEFYKQYGLKTTVVPVSTAEYGASIAARPFNSRLDKSKLLEAGFQPLPDWRDAVKRYIAEAEL